ncbi:hypothetical protein PENSTE_c015G03777 [Penicillium steckii]|uniref:Pectate lyase n=1 Tax=Penicillium steckii TaxID=303698 RepID=A0A1V6SZP2_9EURO|nr:hypothetical protein PENSTE_c015G03777 [Penicillium steckii]
MKLLSFILLLAPALAEVICETSDASPSTEDVTGVINQFNGDSGSSCAQGNNYGSKCTTCGTHGSAKIAVCGDINSTGRGMNRGALASYANAIQQECLSNGKAGGKFLVPNSEDYRIEVSHS